MESLAVLGEAGVPSKPFQVHGLFGAKRVSLLNRLKRKQFKQG